MVSLIDCFVFPNTVLSTCLRYSILAVTAVAVVIVVVAHSSIHFNKCLLLLLLLWGRLRLSQVSSVVIMIIITIVFSIT